MKNRVIISFFLISIFLISSCNRSNPNIGWTHPSSSLDNKGIRSVCSIGANLYVGSDYGAYMSSNGGNTWVLMSASLVNTVKNDPSYNVYNADTTIRYVFSDGIAFYAIVNQIQPTSNYFSSWIFKTIDNGVSWSKVWTSVGVGGITCISFVDNKIFVENGSGIISSSSDNGNTWSHQFDTQEGLLFYGDASPVVSDGTRFITANGGRTIESSDNGQTFQELPNSYGYVATIGSQLFGIDRGGMSYPAHNIYRSANNGGVWTNISSGIVSGYVPQLIGPLYTDGTSLYCGTNERVYKSTDYGNSWTKVGGDIPSQSLTPEFLLKNGGFLYAFTGYGVFKTPA